jgi:predicted MFS family arabinose efflux permease
MLSPLGKPSRTQTERFPLMGLLALSATAFLTILTETMPAAVLPAMADSLEQTTAGIGQLVSFYALASAAAAIPVVALTRAVPRRMLYVILVLTFTAANTITALSSHYPLTVASRVVAGLAAGVIWPVICGYAIRLVDAKDMGRALAITLAGSTAAMVAGLPLGSLLGSLLGWRFSYGLLSLLSVLLVIWVVMVVPPAPGERPQRMLRVGEVLRLPGLRPILLATFFGIVAHYTLYTYMAPLAGALGLPGGTAQGLLLFGAGALIGVMLAGHLVTTHLRKLAIAALLVATVMVVMLMGDLQPTPASLALLLWGASFGGLPTVFQSATATVTGASAELGTAMLTTVYNIGIFAGGAIGGVVISQHGVGGLGLIAGIALCAALVVVLNSTQHAFPSDQAAA